LLLQRRCKESVSGCKKEKLQSEFSMAEKEEEREGKRVFVKGGGS
jgi:hypothetical protein